MPTPPLRPAQPSAPVQIAIPVASPVAAAPSSGISAAKEAIMVSRIFEEMRPVFQKDGGDVELVDIKGPLVLVNMTGTCAGCQLASQTLGGIQQQISAALGRTMRVMPAARI
jgi:NifU-like protein